MSTLRMNWVVAEALCSSATVSWSKWPTAYESTALSLSKNSPDLSLVKPPSALAMSAATEGFSAMISALPMQVDR